MAKAIAERTCIYASCRAESLGPLTWKSFSVLEVVSLHSTAVPRVTVPTSQTGLPFPVNPTAACVWAAWGLRECMESPAFSRLILLLPLLQIKIPLHLYIYIYVHTRNYNAHHIDFGGILGVAIKLYVIQPHFTSANKTSSTETEEARITQHYP